LRDKKEVTCQSVVMFVTCMRKQRTCDAFVRAASTGKSC
jgi:hypothetical protein